MLVLRNVQRADAVAALAGHFGHQGTGFYFA
jgi:hypothetical protein